MSSTPQTNTSTRLSKLSNQSTWSVFFLSLITLGLYYGHYVSRQTAALNTTPGIEPLSRDFANLILAFVYISVSVYLVSLKIELSNGSYASITQLMHLVSSFISFLCGVLITIWCFKIRNRINTAYAFTHGATGWVSGLWCLLFQLLYINYKINTLAQTEQSATDPTPAN